MTKPPVGAILHTSNTSTQEERTMEAILMSDAVLVENAIDRVNLVHAWRAEQLRRLGFSRAFAKKFAGVVDWHEIAALVARGCPPDLALEIVR
jgi:hypothetical protein